MRSTHALVRCLKEKGLTLAMVESIACGMAAYKLSNIKGISEVLKGSVVCYRPEMKKQLLNISSTLIQQYTCESMQVTEALCRELSKKMTADVYAAVTGLASSNGTESKDKPVGSSFLCVLYKNKLHKRTKVFRGTPLEIKNKVCLELYDFIQSIVNA